MNIVKIKQLHPTLILCYIFGITGGILSCQSYETNKIEKRAYNVLVVVSHPDDETLVSGTLAKFIDKGCNIHVIYVTSGDGGADMTGKGLWGEALARQRELEAEESLKCIGITNPPILLKYPDGYVWEHREEIEDTLSKIFLQLNPDVVISFGPDGVTDSPDHLTTGAITDRIYHSTDTGKLLLHIAISQRANHIYPIPSPVADSLIDLRMDVSAYRLTRFGSNNAHRTQFGFGQRLFWRMYVRRFPYEEFVIAGKRDGGDLILRACCPY